MSLRLRRGGIGTGAPSTPVYGPTAGQAAVRAEASPLSVGVFSGTPGTDFTQLNPANSKATNQAAINNDTTGKVWFPAGTYSVTGSAYTFKVSTEYRFESVAGYTRTPANTAVMEGPGNATGSFDAATVPATSTFKGGKWQNFTSGISNNGTMQDVEITFMFNVGAGLGGGATARRCYIHSNGNFNLTAAGTSPTAQITNVTIKNCRLSDGNTRQNDFGNDAGCTKFLFVDGMTIDHNWVELNFGSGLWWDTSCVNIICEENVLENNRWSGLFYEDCGGGTIFRHNALYNNGDLEPADGANANFQLSSADVIETPGSNNVILIEWNTFDGDGTQTSLWMHNAHFPPELCRGVHIQDNEFYLRTSAQNRAGGSNVGGQFAGQDLTWVRNLYRVDSLSTNKWHWDATQFNGNKSWAQWQALGFDTAGTRIVI